MHNDLPIACTLDVFSSEERARHRVLTEEIRVRVEGLRELPDGYALRLPSDPSTYLAAAEFALLEHRCCPFFRIALELEEGQGPLWLRLTGAEGVKEFLRARLHEDC
jgi:hypothetical protein